MHTQQICEINACVRGDRGAKLLEERWNLVDVAFCSCIHTLSNAWGKQFVIRNGKGLLSKAQQVVGGFTSTMDDDLYGVTQAA